MGSPKSEKQVHLVLDQVLGYLNFSSGNEDPKFFANLNYLFEQAAVETQPNPDRSSESSPLIAQEIGRLLSDRLDQISIDNPTFREASQARSVIDMSFRKVLPAYRKYHGDLLFHQSDEFLFNSFFVGRVLEAVLQQQLDGARNSRIDENEVVQSTLHRLNDYIGHRPVATLESQKIEPYAHEWIRPVPIFIRGAGVAVGPYQEIVEQALNILTGTDAHLLRAAHFDPDKMDELSIDPRAFDFDHPINQRPNHHFGQWDDHLIDGSGSFRRFIIHQVTLDALLERVGTSVDQDGTPIAKSEAMFEAAAVLACTMLMAAGISGGGPGSYDSNTTLSTLLPVIANYRDQFYNDLIRTMPIQHAKRLEQESESKHQAFGEVRQDLNSKLAQRRASQLVNCRVATIFARMGYPDAAEQQSRVVPVAAARINCQIDCLLSAASDSLQRNDLDEAFDAIPKIVSRLKRGIQCGAIVDPWNILGFDANYSLFPALENTVRDYRVFDLVDIMERIFAHCSRLWSEAAARDRSEMGEAIRKEFLSIVDWWRKFAAHEVMSVDAVDADDIFQAAELVAEALSLWHKGGAATGDIEFWALHAELFDSPKAYALVVDALMQRSDYQTSTALLVHWLSQAEYVPLQMGDSSFHNLVFRWISDQKNLLHSPTTEDAPPPEEIWERIRKFYDFIEANADHYWEVPLFQIHRRPDHSNPSSLPYDQQDGEFEDGPDPEEEAGNLYDAAYDDVVYKDKTDDGFEGEIFDGDPGTDDSLEAEADRVLDRLEFLSTVSAYWAVAATIPLPVIRSDQLTTPLIDRLKNRRDIIRGWVQQATKNRTQLLELLGSINAYSLPRTGSDHNAMLIYDQQRLDKDCLLEQAIHTCIETENAIRMLVAVIQAIDYLVDEQPISASAGPAPNEGPEPIASYVNGGAPVVCVYSALLLQDPQMVVENFPDLIQYLRDQSLLYVPLSKGGDPTAIVQARVVQTAILDLLGRLSTLGLLSETHELTKTALEMERDNPIGSGAVTEFDEIFEIAFTSMVHALVQSTSQLKQQRIQESNLSQIDIKKETQTVLFDCIEMLTESMLILWLDHSKTLRLSILEKVVDEKPWEQCVDFIKNYGNGLFTQHFLHLANIRAILHQGVDHWLEQVEQSASIPDIRLFDELGQVLPRKKAVHFLTLILESVIENYNEYRDYNTTTTQSDSGESLYMFLDFLRLRSRYDRVCWNLKPVVWAHRILVNDQVNGVARMWRRSLTERVGPEAEKYLQRLTDLRNKYSIQMTSVGRRLEGRFGHQLQIDRLKALVAPAMANPGTRASFKAFELLQLETRAFSRTTMGVGVDLPAWLAALEFEVEQNLLPQRLRNSDRLPPSADPMPLPIANLREQLEQLPRREEA